MLCTVSDIIDALGGTVATAKLAGVGKSAVSNWKERDAIPCEYFVLLSAELDRRNLRFDRAVFGFKAGAAA